MAIVLLPDTSALMKVTLGCGKNLNYNLTKCQSQSGTDILWNEEATCQEEEAQSDDDDDLLFNDEDIMSTEQIQQLFMESDDEDFIGFE